jgi:myo-inositol-1(or 4)-monophosphatase
LSEAGGIVVDANPGNWKPALEGQRYLAIRGDGSGEAYDGGSSGQRKFVEEFWANVEGRFEVGK